MKLFLPLFAGSLLIVAAVPGIGGRLRAQAQAPAPAPAAAPAQTPTPAMAPTPAAAPAPQGNFPRNPVKPTPESQAKAKGVYGVDCAVCHGDNGNGKTDLATSMSLTLADWSDPKTLADRQDGELFNIIRKGKDKMPPEESGRATDSEVWNLIIYIRSFSKGGSGGQAAASPANPQ